MNHILDRFHPPTTVFRPKTATQVFAFRLAQKLDDARAAAHYVSLADTYSETQLLVAYRRTLRLGVTIDKGRRFHVELERSHSNGHNGHEVRLISVRVERRAIAVAIFIGDHLEHSDSRQLSSVQGRAVSSAVGFIQWILERFQVDSAALESFDFGHEIQRRVLHDAIREILRDRMLPIWEVPRLELLEAHGYPSLKSRKELREIATSIWPVIAGTHAKVFIQDAAILGLHVQTERLFIIN